MVCRRNVLDSFKLFFARKWTRGRGSRTHLVDRLDTAAEGVQAATYGGTSLIRNSAHLEPYRNMPRAL